MSTKKTKKVTKKVVKKATKAKAPTANKVTITLKQVESLVNFYNKMNKKVPTFLSNKVQA